MGYNHGPEYESVRYPISETFETLAITADVVQNTAMTSTFARQPCFKSTGFI